MTIENLGSTGAQPWGEVPEGIRVGQVLAATDPASAGPEHVTTPVAYDAILLAGFGGPEGQDDVIPFLRNVTRGRGIPDERLEEVAHHYRHFGGVSPINDQNRELKAALDAEIARRGLNLPVYWGNRNWDPYLADALQQGYDDGHRTFLTIATSAYSSFSSCRQYREDVAIALEKTGLEGQVRVDKVRQYFDHPGFVEPFVLGVKAAVQELLMGVDGDASKIRLLFATHSVPTTDGDRSGPRDPATRERLGLAEGGAYAAQHLAVSEVIASTVAEQLGLSELGWDLVYQSRSGPPTQPWLEPDINDRIAELPDEGYAAVAIVPVGFLSDHMEVMWDLDEEAVESSEQAGLAVLRVPTPGSHSVFVRGLVDLVEERLNGTPAEERPHLTDLGPWYDVCRPGCCENVRAGFKPAASGIAP